MTKNDWTITLTCPDYLQGPVTYKLTSAQMLEASRSKVFSELFAGSQVEGALVAYGEAVQDGAND